MEPTKLENFVERHETELLASVLSSIGRACQQISAVVSRTGLSDIVGEAGVQNASGEVVQKLDIMTDEIMARHLKQGGKCVGFASEENESFVDLSLSASDGDLVVMFDPLDGSSNIDVGVSIGTIFTIYHRVSPSGGPCALEDFLQPGKEQIAAGYAMYGSSTILVYANPGTEQQRGRNGMGRVNGFTLDPSTGDFMLSHPAIRIPDSRIYYSVNHASYSSFQERTRVHIDGLVESGSKLRYVGSMVADLHRTLIKGGVFLYPSTVQSPNGKLRLLYECNPMSLIVESAGGAAVAESGNTLRVLDIRPSSLHQRTPIVIGSDSAVRSTV